MAYALPVAFCTVCFVDFANNKFFFFYCRLFCAVTAPGSSLSGRLNISVLYTKITETRTTQPERSCQVFVITDRSPFRH